MSRDEAHQLDAYPLGQILRYMLTGVPPNKSVIDALSQAETEACIGCLLTPIWGRRPRPRLVDPGRLSEGARKALTDFCAVVAGPEGQAFTVFDAFS